MSKNTCSDRKIALMMVVITTKHHLKNFKHIDPREIAEKVVKDALECGDPIYKEVRDEAERSDAEMIDFFEKLYIEAHDRLIADLLTRKQKV